VNAAEREDRDADILRLFVAGSSYRQIARAVQVSLTTVHRVVQKQLAAGSKRRELLSDQALDVYTERTERLFQAHWSKALNGDHRSAELCRRILAQQARLHGLEADLAPLPAPTPTAGDTGDGEEEPQDELAKLRAARTGA
jgi:hypothetical protein